MALTKTTVGVTNISDLSSTPNETEGLTATQLQAKFDKTGSDLKTYINDTLTVEQDAINTNYDNVTKYLTATAGSNGDYYVDIPNTLATNMKINISFPAATDNTKNARLSIDGGSTYKNIKFFDTTQVLASEIETKYKALYYNGTDLILLDESFSRTNAIGTYTKYKDGTMTSIQEFSITININSSAGSLYNGSETTAHSFPVIFYAAPYIILNSRSEYSCWLGNGPSLPTITTSSYKNLYFYRGTSTTNAVIYVTLKAIGRWKA